MVCTMTEVQIKHRYVLLLRDDGGGGRDEVELVGKMFTTIKDLAPVGQAKLLPFAKTR